MKRGGFTLIEIILVIAISAILSIGTFKAIEALYIRSMKAQSLTRLSLDSQVVLDQLGSLLDARIPVSVIGYDPDDGSFVPLVKSVSAKPMMEWLSTAKEAHILKDYSGFIDMDGSDKNSKTLYSPDTDGEKLDATEKRKFDIATSSYDTDRVRLVFSGSFDEGYGEYGSLEDAFGWHGKGANHVYKIKISSDGNISLTGDKTPAYIYEKYYIADSAYGVARGESIDLQAACIQNLGIHVDANTLFLFFDYRPWKNESFCADKNSTSRVGGATVLGYHATGFRAEWINGTLRLSLDMSEPIRGSTPVHISKQKVVF